MLKVMKTMQFARSLVLGIVNTTLLFGSALAQNRDSEELRDTSPSYLASHFLLNADLIAVGEFGTPVELGNDPISLLRSRELDILFTIRIVYKGDVGPGDVVQVRLRNDMLAYPGEDISRYEKRLQLFHGKLEELQRAAPEVETVEQQFDRGDITLAERGERLRDIDLRNAQLISESSELTRIQRVLIVSHGPTFYDKSGVIQSDTSYLIAVDSVDGNVSYYSLGETGPVIMWGELANDTRSEIGRLRASNLTVR
jgi:hypothetical protein